MEADVKAGACFQSFSMNNWDGRAQILRCENWKKKGRFGER
jgi:hypothetical protein